jgi:hypothetical protein
MAANVKKEKKERSATQVYYLYELCDILKISKKEMQDMVERNFEGFPFSVTKVGVNSSKILYIVPKYQVDAFLISGEIPQKKVGFHGRPTKQTDTDVEMKIRVPRAVSDNFDKCVKNMNKVATVKIGKYATIAVAMVEFMERRPEFMGDD